MTNFLSGINNDVVFLLQQIFVIFSSIFAFYKLFISLSSSILLKRIKVYNLTKEFISDLHDQSIHCFVLEKGFLALTGMLCSVSEIKFLLSLKSPILAIEQRIISSDFLIFNESDRLYSWNSIYKFKIIRKCASYFFFVTYVITVSIGVYPIIYGIFPIFKEFYTLIFSISFLFIAFWALSSYENFNAANKFILFLDSQHPASVNDVE